MHMGALWRTLKEMLYGMTAYEFERQALVQRAELEDLFVIITMGNLIGIPILPPYYTLRLVPYMVGRTEAWKRRLLRQREPLEKEEFDLIEM